MSTKRFIAIAVAVSLLGVAARADYVEVSRGVTLKAAPAGNAAVLEHLTVGVRLELLQDQQENGYYKVRLPASGLEGWVYRTFVRRFAGPIPAVSAPPAPRGAPGAAPSQAIWVRFDRDFIDRHFHDELAFGTLTLDEEWKASSPHSASCGGSDGEIHVGAYERFVAFDPTEVPFSRLVDLPTVAWGLVAEPPNVRSADSQMLEHLEGSRVTFTGYFRVWNEGHYDDEKKERPGGFSNPNHLLELHPVWHLQSSDEEFEEYDFAPTGPMKNYAGYGLSKSAPMLQAIAAGSWPRAYTSSTSLQLLLSEESNFYQLPVTVREVQPSASGIALRADVCSAVGCPGGQFLFRNLKLVTRSDSQAGNPFKVGEVTELVGIFSVHLGEALRLSANATTKTDAVAVGQALEFYIFGRATKPAVRNSKCQPE